MSIIVSRRGVIPCLLRRGGPSLTVQLTCGGSLPNTSSLFLRHFGRLIRDKGFIRTTGLTTQSPQKVLHAPSAVRALGSITISPKRSSPLLRCFDVLLRGNALGRRRSVRLTGPILNRGGGTLLSG